MPKTAICLVTILALGLCLRCTSGDSPEMTLAPVSLPPTQSLTRLTPIETPVTFPTPSPLLSPAQLPTVGTTPGTPPASEATPTTSSLPTPVETEVLDVAFPIGQVNNSMLGQEVTVEGQIEATESFSAGFKFTLVDSTGQIVLLMWQAVYRDCEDGAGLNLNARVRATGTLDEYGGELQVQPTWGGGVSVIEPTAAWAEPRQLGSLSGSDEGRRVMVEGEVLRTAGGSSWVKVFLADESGEMGVFLWRNVLDLIPNNTGLGTAGSRVRVVGTVTIYQSNLEIVPTLPYDVTVIEIPYETD